jgi:hypothetical protein
VINNDGQYRRPRGAFPSNNSPCEAHIFLKLVASLDIPHRATASVAFHDSDERLDPPKCHPNTRLAVLTKTMRWIKREEDKETFIMWIYVPRWSWEVRYSTNYRRDVRGGDDFARKLLCPKERSIVQHFQATFRHHHLPRYL